jgi:Large eukaryotic DNA virus major capsid protein
MRLAQLGSDYFSLVQPYYQPCATIPAVSGYHMYSYSLDFMALDPMGSTNYGKLTNVSIVPQASAEEIAAALGTLPAGSGGDYVQTYSFIITAVNNNIIRISGGRFFPNAPPTGDCVTCQ